MASMTLEGEQSIYIDENQSKNNTTELIILPQSLTLDAVVDLRKSLR